MSTIKNKIFYFFVGYVKEWSYLYSVERNKQIKPTTMTTIRFNDKDLEKAHQKDLMALFSHIISHVPLMIKDSIYVTKYSYEEDPRNKLMCRVVIKIQSWNKGESGKGTITYWVSSRAKDFCCGNTDFQSFPPMPYEA